MLYVLVALQVQLLLQVHTPLPWLPSWHDFDLQFILLPSLLPWLPTLILFLCAVCLVRFMMLCRRGGEGFPFLFHA
uniref:Uncharacterized protein n=1 Tax=Triticum urartu TaxID=4572 RepID=A0A8R7TH52_TRIUA